jgi:hypothetical protein
MINSAENSSIALSDSMPLPIDIELESKIDGEIASLWSAHAASVATTQRTKLELVELRRQLGERLSEMKRLLVCTGRGGRWAGYLRSHKLPRATADRYVDQHHASMTPPAENCLTDAIPEPTLADVHRLVGKLLPTLRRILTTEELVAEFIHRVVQQLADRNQHACR